MPELLQFPSGPRTRARAVRVGELAERQSGIVTRSQLRRLGMSNGAIARGIGRRWLVPLHPAVFAVGHGAVSLDGRLRAALYHAGPGAVLSRTTAGWWWGVIEARPRVIHLDAPIERSRTSDLRVHRPRRVERVVHRGLPVTPVPRTLLALASTLRFDELQRAIAEADHRGFLDPRAVHAVLGRGRRGSDLLRRAIDIHLPSLARTRSMLEQRFLTLIQANALPQPQVNVRVGRFLVDAVWRERRLVVELDGHATHARVAIAERDRERDLELRGAGYVVLRYTWQQVTRQPERVVADLRTALAARPPTIDPS